MTEPTTAPEIATPEAETAQAATPETPVAPLQTFADFGVDEAIVGSLADVGILHPFPIQALTLPVALQRHDIIGQAKTGTGISIKTVEAHRANIMEKLNANTVADLLKIALGAQRA